MPSSSRLPSLDADAPVRVAINTYAERLAALAGLAFLVGVVMALLLACIAGISGTQLLNLPITAASGLFCFSMPIVLVAIVVVRFTALRQFRYADRRLAATIAALRNGDEPAREQLLLWAADHPIRVRDALRQHYHPDLLPALLPLVQDPDPARRQLAHVLLDLQQAAVLPALLPLLEGRRRAAYLKRRMRAQHEYEAAFISDYALGPLRRWNGPPPLPNANLLYALLVSWPALASDDDLQRAKILPDWNRDVSWLNGRGDLETRRRPYAFVAVREAAERVVSLRRR